MMKWTKMKMTRMPMILRKMTRSEMIRRKMTRLEVIQFPKIRRSELYPDDDPADHACWYQELHQPRPRTPHIRTIGKKNPNIFRMFLMRSMAMRSSANFTSMRVDLCPWSGPTTTWTSPAESWRQFSTWRTAVSCRD